MACTSRSEICMRCGGEVEEATGRMCCAVRPKYGPSNVPRETLNAVGVVAEVAGALFHVKHGLRSPGAILKIRRSDVLYCTKWDLHEMGGEMEEATGRMCFAIRPNHGPSNVPRETSLSYIRSMNGQTLAIERCSTSEMFHVKHHAHPRFVLRPRILSSPRRAAELPNSGRCQHIRGVSRSTLPIVDAFRRQP
ncbi:hypothetical protein LMG1861_01456 [Achromobacter piechaudii]|uniref:Uncharacterized protein n=1 Tax=Achromobacter piechaudii TaxID=72556 RepID=A0A6S7CMX4_9BURK|nr:hypothetical protein LMG1861_01456 [Achromobacter piechaudii]